VIVVSIGVDVLRETGGGAPDHGDSQRQRHYAPHAGSLCEGRRGVK
jgi:hypothetical protein